MVYMKKTLEALGLIATGGALLIMLVLFSVAYQGYTGSVLEDLVRSFLLLII